MRSTNLLLLLLTYLLTYLLTDLLTYLLHASTECDGSVAEVDETSS